MLAASLMFAALPQAAHAHGPVAPLASSYLARVTALPPGLHAKIVDGDQRMWLEAPPSETVTVLDYQGAPYLRFDSAGVQVNQNSAMYYLNQTPVAETPPPNLTASTPPSWQRASGGHSFSWHDGRLHALAAVALLPGKRLVGNWRVALRIDGRPSMISGGLWHAPDPSIVWFWPIVVLLACVLAARRVRRRELDRLTARGVSLATLAALGAVGIGRGLHGRPTVSVLQWIELAVMLAFVVWALRRVLFVRSGYFIYIAIALIAVWQGVELIPTLVHGYVLIAIPAFLTRACTVVCLGGGVSLLLLAFRLAEEPRSSPPRIAASGAPIAGVLLGALLLGGCGSTHRSQSAAGLPAALVAESRPIGSGASFHPPAAGPVLGRCEPRLGSRVGVHVELFAADRVVIIPGGIGTRAPLSFSAGRIAGARCFGELVTLEPTGVVLVRRGAGVALSNLFRSWGQPLSARRVAGFAVGGGRVAAFVDGRRWRGNPGDVPLAAHSEIVLEVGPYVPPHAAYAFPPGA
ncbi:MAG: hypothetical protein JO206_05875 [Solirubrobacterales bacterium]|nr:hypothetical protein [Solirubrobacterales bacterium]